MDVLQKYVTVYKHSKSFEYLIQIFNIHFCSNMFIVDYLVLILILFNANIIMFMFLSQGLHLQSHQRC